MENQIQSFIKIEGGYADHHKITADVLHKLPDGFQKLIYLFACIVEKQTESKQIPKEIKEKYTLLFGTENGSFGLPATFQADLENNADQLNVIELFQKTINSLNDSKPEELNQLIPDSLIRRRILNEIKEISPKKEDYWKWNHSINNDLSKVVYVNFKTREAVQSLKKSISGQRIIKGAISKIDLISREISIFYKPTNRDIKIPNVQEDFHEIKLFGDSVYVEVTGLFNLNENDDFPKELKSRDYSIEIVDLSPIHITNDLLAEYETGLKLKDGKTITLEVQLDEESEQVYTVTDDRFFMHDFGETREELISMVMSDFELSWKTYVINKENHNLSKDSKLFKQSLMEYFEGVKQE